MNSANFTRSRSIFIQNPIKFSQKFLRGMLIFKGSYAGIQKSSSSRMKNPLLLLLLFFFVYKQDSYLFIYLSKFETPWRGHDYSYWFLLAYEFLWCLSSYRNVGGFVLQQVERCYQAYIVFYSATLQEIPLRQFPQGFACLSGSSTLYYFYYLYLMFLQLFPLSSLTHLEATEPFCLHQRWGPCRKQVQYSA